MPLRDISASEALQRLGALYNDLAMVGSIFSPAQADAYREAVLHCIAALHHSVPEERMPLPAGPLGQVLEFRPPT